MGIMGEIFNAAKSFDKGMDSLFNGSGTAPETFGMRIVDRDSNLARFYQTVYFHFGLTPPSHLAQKVRVPITVSDGWNGGVIRFEIHGRILSPIGFLSNGWDNPFNRIERETPAGKGRVWAYDITQLHQGVLRGDSVFPGDEAHRRSEEYLKTLYILGGGVMKSLSSVPSIDLEFGHTWSRFGIPDKVSFQLSSMYPFNDDDLLRLVQLITHNQAGAGAPVKTSYSGNLAKGTMTITNEDVTETQSDIPPQPENPRPSAPQAKDYDIRTKDGLFEFMENLKQAGNPAQQPGPTDDGFPYDFYRGLGLIDNEEMVALPSILGPIRVHMSSPDAKQFLLKYQPEG
ncbi:hypothetical protein [Pseudarthrobacter sulfonivorans]|uniref:hypothetical protein n=1 Tax=Pseudarthrobacter sulfonivorans TaxID=121292 RepID=UPI00285E2F8C|nr:hypothetical protein [Pseudarthrobacter sulfonivorans]MDR6417469.1 hypothetical protein [Pseudarthrobacter sulfonivorans]